jgi:hypothetical protein
METSTPMKQKSAWEDSHPVAAHYDYQIKQI